MKTGKRASLVLLGSCCLAVSGAWAATTTYKWTDSHGVVHYSDQPHQGARRITLAAPATYTPAPTPTMTTSEQPNNSAHDSYTGFEITQPQAKQTFRNTAGQIPVTVTLDSRLKRGDQISYRVDGKQTASSPTRALSVTLTGMNRGMHTIQAQIETADSVTKAQTDPVTFFVKQHSISNPHPHGPLTNNNFSFKYHHPHH